jgi:hypothetical protein
VRRGAELFYQQLDGLSVVRHTVRGELLAECRKHQAVKILRQPLTLLHVTFAPRQKARSKEELKAFFESVMQSGSSAKQLKTHVIKRTKLRSSCRAGPSKKGTAIQSLRSELAPQQQYSGSSRQEIGSC